VIHLVSGFQVAGFPHVVGSMWPSVDQICAEMARVFYEQVCQVDEGVLVQGSVARALHAAVVYIRQRWWLEPLAWAQYVHYGA
jgi:CHAT domain-containing protein